jgi:RNA polymerase sigma factor for flagellar operon FliA
MDDLNILWERLKKNKDSQAREKLIVAYAHLARYAVDRMNLRPSGVVSREDLISHAIVGLIDAVDRFDPLREVKFETYAMTRIKGSVLDALKSLDWMPRSVRNSEMELKRTMARLESELGYPPSDQQIASEMGITIDKLNALLASVGQSAMMSLDELLLHGDDCEGGCNLGSAPGDEFNPMASYELEERTKLLAKAIGELPEREKLVISLYYKECMTLKEISLVIGVTEGRVCQLHSKAVLRLQGKLARHMDLMLCVA